MRCCRWTCLRVILTVMSSIPLWQPLNYAVNYVKSKMLYSFKYKSWCKNDVINKCIRLKTPGTGLHLGPLSQNQGLRCNEHFDVRTMGIFLGSEVGHCSKGRGFFFISHFFWMLHSLNSFFDSDHVCTKICMLFSYFARESLNLKM